MMDSPAGTAVATWLLRSRVSPPRHGHRLIQRTSILKSLGGARGSWVIVVDAPPGFGKSALLEQLSVLRRDAGTHTAWLTLDSSDNPESTIRYLAFSLHVAGLDLSHTTLLHTGTLRPPKRSLQLQTLIAAIEESPHGWLLVIDDLERASPGIIRDILEPFARFVPHNLTLAFGTRGPAPIDLCGLSDRGLLIRVGPEQLRFERTELRAVLGQHVSTTQARVIERRTDGWPALVQFLRDEGVMTSRGNKPTCSSEFAPTVGGFFEAHILRRLDTRLAQLVLRLSLLPFFSTDLVRELFGSEETPRDLILLERLGVTCHVSGDFKMPLAIRPIFQDYFAKRLARENAAETADVRRRAASAFVLRGAYIEAVQLAVLTGDTDFIADTMEAIEPVLEWVKHGLKRMNLLLRLVPENVVRQRPRVGYARVISLIKAGHVKDAQDLFNVLEQVVHSKGSRESERAAPALCERALCASMLRVARCIPVSKEMIDELDSLSKEAADFRPILLAESAILRCYELQHAGSFDAARKLAHECLELAVTADSRYLAFFSYCDLALMTGVEGKVREAFALFDQCDLYCQGVVREDERLSLIRDAFRLELEHEVNPLDSKDILRLKNICVRVPRLEGWLDVFAAAFRTYSEKLYIANDLRAALASLSVGIELFRAQDIHGAANVLLAQRVLLLALGGSTRQALTECGELDRALEADSYRTSRSWREVEAFLEARALVDLVRGKAEVSAEVDNQIVIAQCTGNVRSELRLRHLRSIVNRSAGPSEDSARIDCLEKQHRFTRSAVLVRAWLAGAGRHYEMSSARSNLEFFTEREIQILDKLSHGLSDKQIAKDLGITPHGVRYHLKHIYAKLNVPGRTEARTRAVKLGIFQPTPTIAH